MDEKIFSLSGKKEPQTIFPNVKGKEIAIDFVCEKPSCNISNPQVIVGVI